MRTWRPFILGLLFSATITSAQVPQLINYQGRVTVGGTNVTGNYNFRFALVNTTGAVTYWSNGTSSVSLSVNKGLYSVLLGDTSVPNMAAMPASVFTNSDVRLRVWFDPGSGLQQLSPDQRISAVGYALMSANVPDGLITSDKLADGAVTSSKLGAGAVGSSQLASNLTNGIVPWQVNGGLTPPASVNTGYILTNATLTELLLPSAANVGDVVRVSGVGVGGWQIIPNVGQSIAGYSAAFSFGATWTARAGATEAYYGLATDYDGSTIIGVASYSGQIWISHDYGTNWMTKGSVSYWTAAASSADGTKLAVINNSGGGNGQIYTSTDGGTNWAAQGSVRNWNSIASSADGTRLVATVSGGQIYVSTDAGTNWVAREQNRNWASITSSADGMKLAATVSGGQIYTSTDGGINWTARATNQNWTQIASSADGTKLFTAVSGGYLYTSSDSGVTWTQRGSAGNWLYLASSADGNRLIVNDHGNPGYLYVSIDGGVTWTQKATGRYWRQVAMSGNGKLVAAASDRQGGIYVSGEVLTGTTVAGAQGTTAALQYMGNGVWQPLNEALVGTGAVGSSQLASNAVQTVNIAVGAVGTAQLASNVTVTGTFIGDGSGLTNLPRNVFTWQTVAGTSVTAAPNTGYLCTNNAQVTVTLPAAPVVGDVVRVSGIGAGGWRIAQNAGQSVLAGSALTMSPWVTWTTCESNRDWYGIASSADGRYWTAVVQNGGQIYTSADYGQTWTARETNRNWKATCMSTDGVRQFAVPGGDCIYRSMDSGITWTPCASTQNWASVACSADGTKLVTGVDGGYVWTSSDSGLTWTQHTSLGSARWLAVAASADGTTLYAAGYGDGAVYKSTNGAASWVSIRGVGWYRGLACSADGRKLVLSGWNTPIYTSSDGGATWTARESSRSWVGAASSADGTKLIVVTGNDHAYTSADSGVTWTVHESVPGGNWVACSADGSRMAAVGLDMQIYLSRPALVQPTTATTIGTSGYLIGGQNSAIELQYGGNGQWMPISHTGSIFGY